jgi:hypothetical protein
MLVEAAPNDFGLTKIGEWDGMLDGKTLHQQLDAEGVGYERVALSQIVGMGGSAELVLYTSPRSGQPMTVLCVPHRADVDQFAETYYYFEGMPRQDTLAGDWEVAWAERYDQAEELFRALGWTQGRTMAREPDDAELGIDHG